MKKAVALILTTAMAFSMAACGKNNVVVKTDSETESFVELPTEDAEDETADTNDDLIEFDGVILVDDEIVTIELVNFYAVDMNWAEGLQNEKCFSIKVTNKSNYDLSIGAGEMYLNNERMYVAMNGGNLSLAPGCSGNGSYIIARDTLPQHTALESFDELYGLQGTFFGTLMENNQYKDNHDVDFSFSAAFSGDTASADKGVSSASETDYITVEGLYVDNSYTTSDNDTTKMFYIVYDAHTSNENLKIDCKSMTVTFNGVNSYQARRSNNQVRYMPNYYNGAYLKEVNIGESAKFVETFEVPAAELEAGRTITVSKSQIPQCEQLMLSTDDIVFCNSPEEVGSIVDPEGCEHERWALADADEATVNAVHAECNGYKWDATIDSIHYQIEFYSPNSYELRTTVANSEGTYEVKNGYIICTNTIGGVIEIPFTNDNGVIDVDILAAFDPYK